MLLVGAWAGGCLAMAGVAVPASAQGARIAKDREAAVQQVRDIFISFDLDRNGVLSASEQAALASEVLRLLAGPQPVNSPLAKSIDSDGDGRLSGIEVSQARARLLGGVKADAAAKAPLQVAVLTEVLFEPAAGQTVRNLKRNKAGQLQSEQLDVLQARTVIGRSTVPIDRNGDRVIDGQELEAWQARTVIGLLEADLDRNGDRLIDPQEFERLPLRAGMIGAAPAPAATAR